MSEPLPPPPPPAPFEPIAAAREHGRIIFHRRFAGDADCPICLAAMRGCSVSVYPCGHCVHNRCDAKMRTSRCRSRHRCPMCREPLPRDDPNRLRVLMMTAGVDLEDLLVDIYAILSQAPARDDGGTGDGTGDGTDDGQDRPRIISDAA